MSNVTSITQSVPHMAVSQKAPVSPEVEKAIRVFKQWQTNYYQTQETKGKWMLEKINAGFVYTNLREELKAYDEQEELYFNSMNRAFEALKMALFLENSKLT